jgi:hypothetical protein
MIKRTICAAAATLACSAYGSDLNNIGNITQDQLRGIAEDLGAAFSYKGVTPATPLGPLGLDIGVELTDTNVKNSSAFSAAGGGSPSDLFIPKIHIYKGLGLGFDIGGFFGGSSTVGATLIGLDLRYAFVDDTLTTPAFAVRVSGTRAQDMGDLTMNTAGLDLMISKKLTAFTPYAGIGTVRVQSNVKGTSLGEENFNKGRGFVGLNTNFLGANFAAEYEQMGSNPSISVKLGLRF